MLHKSLLLSLTPFFQFRLGVALSASRLVKLRQHGEAVVPNGQLGEDTLKPSMYSNIDTDLGFSRTRGEGPRFYYKHLTKAGGTFGRALLNAVFADEDFYTINEDDAALPPPEQRTQEAFVAVTMRNPCDLYVSFANFHPGKAFAYGPTYGPNPLGNDRGPYSVAALREWLLDSRLPDGTGFYSYYFWSLVIAPECAGWFQKGRNHEPHPSSGVCNNSTRIALDLQKFSPQKLAQCWIFQETMMNDFRRCLKAYEKSSTLVAGSVNWTRFEHIASNVTLQDELLSSYPYSDVYRDKSVAKSSSRHPQCRHYFPQNNPEMQGIVRKSDPHLFGKFGYRQCCVASDHHIS